MLDNEEGITSVQTSKATKIAKISKINYVSSRSILNRGKQKEPEMQVSGQKD
jgi:hypothetical protein